MRKRLVASSVIFVALATSVYADTEIDQVNKKFSQTDVTIKAGESIKILNKDTVIHNIKVLNGDDADDKGLQKPGEIITIKFDKPGPYQVRCNIHPTMRMNVTVQ